MDDYYDDFDHENNDFNDYHEDDYHEDDIYDHSEESNEMNDSNEKENRHDYDIDAFELAIALGIGEEIADERRNLAISDKKTRRSFWETENKKKDECNESEQRVCKDEHTSFPKKTTNSSGAPKHEEAENEAGSVYSKNEYNPAGIFLIILLIVICISFFKSC